MSVGSDVLHRRAAHAARDTAEALDAGIARQDHATDEAVPALAGSDLEEIAAVVVTGLLLDSGDGNL